MVLRKVDAIEFEEFLIPKVHVSNLSVNERIIYYNRRECDEVIQFVNCEFNYFDAYDAKFLNTVTFSNCIFHNFSVSAYFENSLIIESCVFSNGADFSCSSASNSSSDITIKDCVFNGFVDFFDCDFLGSLNLLNNNFKMGTNILNQDKMIVIGKELISIDNVGKLDL